MLASIFRVLSSGKIHFLLRVFAGLKLPAHSKWIGRIPGLVEAIAQFRRLDDVRTGTRFDLIREQTAQGLDGEIFLLRMRDLGEKFVRKDRNIPVFEAGRLEHVEDAVGHYRAREQLPDVALNAFALPSGAHAVFGEIRANGSDQRNFVPSPRYPFITRANP